MLYLYLNTQGLELPGDRNRNMLFWIYYILMTHLDFIFLKPNTVYKPNITKPNKQTNKQTNKTYHGH